MALRRKGPDLNLTEEEIEHLDKVCRSSSLSTSTARRAFTLLAYHKGMSTSKIARILRTQRSIVERCIAGAARSGVIAPNVDLQETGQIVFPAGEVDRWVCELASRHPKEFGYTAEAWSKPLLARHVRSNCRTAGYPFLARLGCGAIWSLLPSDASNILAD